jgi:flagellar capping protein FliD
MSAVNTAEGGTTLTDLQQYIYNNSSTLGFTASIVNNSDGTVPAGTNVLSGSMTIQVGGGTTDRIVIGAAPSSPAANTFYTGSRADTLTDVMNAINEANLQDNLGVSAAWDNAGTGLTLTSSTVGATGALTVSSSIVDTTSPTSTTLNYNNSSDINSLTSLGISENNDGTLTFDDSALDSLLNTDYSGVVGFFQDARRWGSPSPTC